jgi:hypothetical protein
MRYKQVIEEIREKSRQPPHRAAYDVHQLLLNNKGLFKDKIADDDLRVILKDLESLSESPPTSYQTSLYKRENEQVMNRLFFFLDRLF